MIRCWSRGIADDNMAESILIELADATRGHPWWRARAQLTLALLADLGVDPPAHVLDAGCGWGVTLESLERAGYSVVGLDIARDMLERLDRPDRTLIEADLTVPFPPEAPTGCFDAVLALDVIEHVDDDAGVVARLAELVRCEGLLIVSVPARPDLLSEFDRVQGHRRRYEPDTLRAAFALSGLQLERVFWWGRWMVPVVRRQRARQLALPGEPPERVYRRYLRLPPWPLPHALRLAFALEQRRAIRQELSTGTSLFAVGRRV